MRIAVYALPVAALVALAACNGNAGEESGDDAAETSTSAAEDTAKEDVVEAEPTPATLDAIPEKFRGYWDSSDDPRLSCTDLSDGGIFVAKKEISFYEATFEPETITQVSSNEIASKGVFNELGDTSNESYRLKLSKDGKRLTLDGDGFDPFEYRKCGAKLKKADLDVVPAEFHGKWAWQDPTNCPANPSSDLFVTEKFVTLGGRKSKVSQLDNRGNGSIIVHYTNSAGKPAEMHLDLIENGQRIAFGEPGSTGTIFAKCS